MVKPKLGDRPEQGTWVENLLSEITKIFEAYPACDMFWSWQATVSNAAISIGEQLTELALHADPNAQGGDATEILDKNLGLIFRALSQEQGGPDCNAASASGHLAVALTESLTDELEHSVDLESVARHGEWLCNRENLPKEFPFAAHLNGLLITTAIPEKAGTFVPGTIFRYNDFRAFQWMFGIKVGEVLFNCYSKVEGGMVFAEWKENIIPVAVEISPACDFHQKTRRAALLLGGLLVPAKGRNNAKRGDAFETLPIFNLRWPVQGSPKGDYFLMFCCRYKATLMHDKEPDWLIPWFRLRELPTASLRNSHSSHSARVGYVSLR
jgi:hypothetical protein